MPCSFQHPHHFKKFIYLLHGQGGGGLIQNNYLRIVGNCLGDSHTSAAWETDIFRIRLGQVDGSCQACGTARPPFSFMLPSSTPCPMDGWWVASQEQIVDDIPLQALVKLLVNHGDSIFPGHLLVRKS